MGTKGMILPMLVDLMKAAQPTTAPRGGKYIKREWSGTRWKYTYANEAGARHGVAAAADFNDPSFAHTVEGASSGNPEKDYHEALDRALAEPGASFSLKNPAGGEDLKLSMKGKKLQVTGGEKTKTFPSRGAYELWYIGAVNTTTHLDHEGNAIFDVRPNVGRVVNGQLIPTNATEKKMTAKGEKEYASNRWIVAYSKSYPKDKRAGTTSKWFKTTRERAEQHADKMLRDQELAQGIKRDVPKMSVTDEKAMSAAEGTSMFAEPGSVADKAQSGELPYRINDAGKRELDLPEGEKNALIAQAAKEYYPTILNAARAAAKGTFFAADSRSNDYGHSGSKGWAERFMGMEIEASKTTPDFVFPDPGSPAYDAIEHALNTYDPANPKRVGFAGYLAGKRGQVAMRMMQASSVTQDQYGFISEIKAWQAGSTADGASVSDFTSATEEQRAGNAYLQSLDDLADNGDVDTWRDSVDTLLEMWKDRVPDHEPEKYQQAKDVIEKFDKMHSVDQIKLAPRISEALMDLTDWKKILNKSLENDAVMAIHQEELTRKAMDILTKDKKVLPEHNYAHMEGSEENPAFYYTDPMGNRVRYTNAPDGHGDRSKYFGEASLHPTEPDITSNPEYFTLDGRKLTRAPDHDDVEWNENYNQYDPQNLWAGRWTDQNTGEQRYTYVDADLRGFPRLQIHQQNAMVDVQIPTLRTKVGTMFASEKLKDQVTAVTLALLDQGRMRAVELSSLTPSEVVIQGNLISLGPRKVYAGPKMREAIETLVAHKAPDEPLFSVPSQDREGKVDRMLSRRVGPHYLAMVLDQLGISLLGLQTYHASQCFAREVERMLTQYGASWDAAVQQGLLASALEWGHDFTQEQDTPGVLQLTQAVLIDPVVIDTLRASADAQGLSEQLGAQPLPPVMIPIPHVSLDMADRTPEEAEFSMWLHSAHVHDYAAE
jgi:hypothetical protein